METPYSLLYRYLGPFGVFNLCRYFADREPSNVPFDRASVVSTHRLHCSSFLGVPYRILNMNHTKELLKEPMGSRCVFRLSERAWLSGFICNFILA